MKRNGLDGRPRRYKRSRWRGDWYREIDVATQFHCSKRGAHAEAMSKASRSGTRFLPTDINQLSRVTNERRESARSRITDHRMYTRMHTERTKKGEHPNDGSRHLLHLRECRISCRLVGSTAVPRRLAPARFYMRLQNCNDESEKNDV